MKIDVIIDELSLSEVVGAFGEQTISWCKRRVAGFLGNREQPQSLNSLPETPSILGNTFKYQIFDLTEAIVWDISVKETEREAKILEGILVLIKYKFREIGGTQHLTQIDMLGSYENDIKQRLELLVHDSAGQKSKAA